MVAEGFVPPIGWPDCLGSALFAGARLLHDSPCWLTWTGAASVAIDTVSGASPRYTRPMPRTRRRIGSSPLASAKKISPARDRAGRSGRREYRPRGLDTGFHGL